MAELTREEIIEKINDFINPATQDRVSKTQLNELLLDIIDSYLLRTGDVAVCEEAIAYLKDSLGVTISTTSILSGGFANIPAPNGTVYVKDSSGVVIKTVPVRSNNTAETTVGNSTVRLINAAEEVISSHTVKAEDTLDVPVDDGVLVIKDSAGAVLYTVTVAINEENEQPIADAQIELKNSLDEVFDTITVKAQEEGSRTIADITVKSAGEDPPYEDNHPVGKDVVIPNVGWTDTDGTPKSSQYGSEIICQSGISAEGIKYNRPQFAGQLTSYRTGDVAWLFAQGYFDFSGDPSNPAQIPCLDTAATNPWKTLKENNIFGNKERFTDKTGTAAAGTNQFLLDHLTGIMYVDDGITDVAFNDAIDNALASTLGGHDDWHFLTYEEFITVANFEQPFSNLMVRTTSSGMSNTVASNTANALATGTLSNAYERTNIQAKTNVRGAIYARAFYWDDEF
jgi:hypothetical protein